MAEVPVNGQRDKASGVARRVGRWTLFIRRALRMIHGSFVSDPGEGCSSGFSETATLKSGVICGFGKAGLAIYPGMPTERAKR